MQILKTEDWSNNGFAYEYYVLSVKNDPIIYIYTYDNQIS